MAAFLLPLALLAGAALPVQFSINAQLRNAVGGPVMAAAISFVVGTLCLLVAFVVSRQPMPRGARLADAPWWVWTGGALGATYVLLSIVLLPRIGAATTVGLIVAGQMVTALVLDHYGLLNVPVHRISVLRVLGAILVIAGVGLIQKF
ncbi:MAG TPA: DMT family transporter [Gaiellaceae bacterium]|jgi:transporter family-2 protein|nr:DMT family transporter [Gaiellaceae bacterium]